MRNRHLISIHKLHQMMNIVDSVHKYETTKSHLAADLSPYGISCFDRLVKWCPSCSVFYHCAWCISIVVCIVYSYTCYFQSVTNGHHGRFYFHFHVSHVFHDDDIKWKHFRVTGHLCGEFTGHRWIPHTKASDAELWCFLWSASEWLSKQLWGWGFGTP